MFVAQTKVTAAGDQDRSNGSVSAVRRPQVGLAIAAFVVVRQAEAPSNPDNLATLSNLKLHKTSSDHHAALAFIGDENAGALPRHRLTEESAGSSCRNTSSTLRTAIRPLAQIPTRAHELCFNLAHGEQRLLEIAVALATNPELLLLDEPLAGLGDADREHIGTLIRNLSRHHSYP